MFAQLLTPVGDSLALSFAAAIIPVVVVLIMLGVLRRPPGRRRAQASSSASRWRSTAGRCPPISPSIPWSPGRCSRCGR